jgi:putative phosphoesterase
MIAGMNVLALYDIHGNAEALEAVLADPRAAGADAVVIGGDVYPGPFVDAVLERLEALDVPTHWVRGNGEREDGTLAHLPLTLELDGVLYCHATPRDDEEILTRISSPERWSEALQDVESALVVAGHTHQQDDRMVGDVRFVNAGSVGLPYEGDGDARWLWVADGVPELRRTAYDSAGAGRRILESGWPDEDSYNAALIDPLEPMEITRMFEERAQGS